MIPGMDTRFIRHTWGQDEIPGDLLSSARVVFANPSYNQGVRYSDDASKDRVDEAQYRKSTEAWISEMARLLVPGGTLWWMIPERHADWTGELLTRLVGPRVHRIVWEETFAQYQQRCLTEDYRFIFCHQRQGGNLVFNPDSIRERSVRQDMGDKRADPRGRVPGCVWKMRRLQGTSIDRVSWHPAQLAPELLQRIVRGWSDPGDLVIDGFAGSGNMALVCAAEKRRHVGFDQSPTYVKEMEGRLSNWRKGRKDG